MTHLISRSHVRTKKYYYLHRFQILDNLPQANCYKLFFDLLLLIVKLPTTIITQDEIRSGISFTNKPKIFLQNKITTRINCDARVLKGLLAIKSYHNSVGVLPWNNFIIRKFYQNSLSLCILIEKLKSCCNNRLKQSWL